MVVSSAEVVWHDLECGAYGADLALWLALAGSAAMDGRSATVLDVGAGTGRVALPLAHAGHQVTAVDIDPDLLSALRARAADTSVETVCADARLLELGRADFDVCLVPMQTVQLLGGPADRVAFLERARAHVRAGGLIALAIVTAFEQFDCAAGEPGPTPETAQVDGALFMSRATRVSVLADRVMLERERLIYPDGEHRQHAGPHDGRSAGEPPAELNLIELQRVDAPQLEHEAVKAGLHPEPARLLDPTDDHVGSTVVMLRV